jgi:hypothetical protein
LRRRWRSLRLGRAEEPLDQSPESAKIASDPDAGEAFEKVCPGIHGRPGDTERDLRVALFGCGREFVAKESPQPAGEVFIEEEAGLKVELAGGVERALGGEDQVFRSKEEVIDHEAPLINTEEALPLGKTE